jgi:HK97 family phage portal protein
MKGWFGREIEEKSISLSDPSIFELFAATPTVSGPFISPATAMTVPAVRNAVVLIASMIGSLPVKVYRRAPQGEGKEVDRDHPAFALAHDDASDELSAQEFRELLTIDALLHDHGFAFISRNFEGRVLELIRLDPSRMTIKQDARGASFFELQTDTGKRTFARDEILKITVPGGVSPIKHGREAIALAIVLERCAARIFAKGGRPSGAITVPGKVGDTGLARLKAAWSAAHGGENSGATAILEDGAKFDQFTFSSVDTEFAAMRRHQVVEIARAFNVPPTMLQALENSSYANTEQLALAFKTFTLGPWLTAWSKALTRALISPEERASHFCEFVADGLVATDTAGRTNQLSTLIQARVMTSNEARAVLNLAPHPEGDRLVNPHTTSTAPAPAPAKDAP